LGLLLGLFGVVLVFLFGMPFRVPTHGLNYIHDSYTNTAGIAIERRYAQWSDAGLGCLVVGTLLQMLALLPPRSR
jgi:hypothetical protein